MSIRVLRGGLLTTVQDAGRTGYQRYGVVAGGAADPFALRVANAVVGNPAGATVLEIAFAGPRLHFENEALVAWCGAEFNATLDGAPLPPNRPVRVAAGGVLDFAGTRHGAMAWLAIAGGVAVPEVMGSRATYLAAGIGGVEGRRLLEGDVLEPGTLPDWSGRMLELLRASGKGINWAIVPERFGIPAPRGILRVMRGPEWDWFSPSGRYGIFRDVYEVTKDSNRMGIRLSGTPLSLTTPREMVSAAVQHGVIQVPASGQPILLGADRQTIGGYPRIGVVATVDYGTLAQLRPGEPVRFQEIPVAGAHALQARRERDFAIASIHLSTPRL